MNNYVSLHNHSDHSILDSPTTIKQLVDKAVDLEMSAVALTDHGTASGLYEFITYCNSKGIKPIPGVEFYVAPEKANNKNRINFGDGRIDVIKGWYTHLTVLAYNNTGLKHLFELVGESYDVNNYCDKPRIDLEMLFKKSEGLIVLSGCKYSELSIRTQLKQKDKITEYINKMKDVFKDNFYIELNDFGVSGEKQLAQSLARIGQMFNVKVVATNNVHYLTPRDAITQEELMAIGARKNMSELKKSEGGLRPDYEDTEHYFKNYRDMSILYPKEYLENTIEIANKVNISLEYNPHLKPILDVPDGYTDETYLRKLIDEGFKKKRSWQSEEIQEESKRRIEEEFEVLLSNDFVSYFLVVQDFISWGRKNGIGFGVGRGSVGGSEIAFLTGISNTDPIRFDLLFERFLSPGRGSICEIEYEDGSKETIMISEKKKLKDGSYKYIHQLVEGDELMEG